MLPFLPWRWCEDNIYVEVLPGQHPSDAHGTLIFTVRRGGEEAQVAAAGAWIPNQPHSYLFTAAGTEESIWCGWAWRLRGANLASSGGELKRLRTIETVLLGTLPATFQLA